MQALHWLVTHYTEKGGAGRARAFDCTTRRGIRRADATTVSDLRAALEKVSAPFLARDLEETLAADSPLRLEGDITGLGTTADMPGVEPGLIEGRLQPGFRMASVSLRPPCYRAPCCQRRPAGRAVVNRLGGTSAS